MAKKIPLTISNADTATFDCSFGRGCDGICCKNGKPSVTKEEQNRILANMYKIREHLRPEAIQVTKELGAFSDFTKLGMPQIRVVKSWCIFFNQGCVLHKLGAAEGNFSKYKPRQCSLFPLEPNDDGTWYVRQWGVNEEQWDLFCLNPANSTKPAVESLKGEIAIAEKLPQNFQWQESKKKS